jgi:hypothetical protein
LVQLYEVKGDAARTDEWHKKLAAKKPAVPPEAKKD